MWNLHVILWTSILLLLLVVPASFVIHLAISAISSGGRNWIRRHRILYCIWGIAAAGSVIWFLWPCSPQPPPPNQQQDIASPNGHFILSVPIEMSTPNEEGKQHVWKVTIRDRAGSLLYKDGDSRMSGWHNVYWGWDAENCVWLYNGDDGWVWRWHLEDGTWRKTKMEDDGGMPDWIFPELVRKIREEKKAEPAPAVEPSQSSGR